MVLFCQMTFPVLECHAIENSLPLQLGVGDSQYLQSTSEVGYKEWSVQLQQTGALFRITMSCDGGSLAV